MPCIFSLQFLLNLIEGDGMGMAQVINVEAICHLRNFDMIYCYYSPFISFSIFNFNHLFWSYIQFYKEIKRSKHWGECGERGYLKCCYEHWEERVVGIGWIENSKWRKKLKEEERVHINKEMKLTREVYKKDVSLQEEGHEKREMGPRDPMFCFLTTVWLHVQEANRKKIMVLRTPLIVGQRRINCSKDFLWKHRWYLKD